MNERPLAAVVLAAGQGKRMRASVPKVLIEACGLPLVEHVLDALAPLDPERTVVVYGHGGDVVKKALGHRDCSFAHQPRQLGTGDAVRCALPGLEGFEGDLLVVCGDTPLLDPADLRRLRDEHRARGHALTVLSAVLADPGSLGRILRDATGGLAAIREAADATETELEVREINTGVILVGTEHLPGALARLSADNAQGELYLTDVPGLLLADGLGVGVVVGDEKASLGVNNPLELAEAVRLLRIRERERHLLAGVRMDDPRSTVIDVEVEIGTGTRLGAAVTIGKGARVGAGCRIGAHAHLAPGVVLEENSHVPPGTILASNGA